MVYETNLLLKLHLLRKIMSLELLLVIVHGVNFMFIILEEGIFFFF